MMLIRMEVTRGKYKVKFFLLMMISPGSLPNHGILSPMSKKTPIKIMKMPSKMSIFPRGPNPTT